jgi:tetratricopeptide (TPR) repeat protein
MPLYQGNPATIRDPLTDEADRPLTRIFSGDLTQEAFHRALVLLLLLGLIIRTGYFVEHAQSPTFGVPVLDEQYYDTVAKMLLTGQDLHELHGFRPLLYPMFLAAMYKLGGTTLALFVQHLLGIATGLIVALLGAQLFQHRLSGVLGGLLYLLAPVPLYFEGELLIESFYTFLICAGLLLHLYAVRAEHAKAGWLWFLGGAVMVLAAQARANILVFLAVYPLLAAWRFWHWRKPAGLMPVFGLAGALVMMAPWGMVNMSQSDHFHLMPNAGGVNLYLGNKRGADGMLVGQDVIASLSELSTNPAAGAAEPIVTGGRYQDLVEVWAREEYNVAMHEQGRVPSDDPMAISKYWTQRAEAEIRADPAAWVELMARKCWLMVWNAEIPNNKNFAFLQQEFAWLRVLPVRWVVLLALLPAGIWGAARLINRDALFVTLAYIGLYSAGNVAFFVCDRYRYPIWPALAALAGGGLLVTAGLIRRQRHEISYLAVIMVVLASFSLHNWADAKIPNFAQDYYFRSAAWYQKGNYPEALDDINRSLRLDPLNPEAMQHRGNVLFAMNRLEDAQKAYEYSLKLLPGDSGTWNNLGAALDAMGRPMDALQAFHHATDCNLPSQTAFIGIALIQVRAGKLDEADAALDQLARLQPDPAPEVLALRSVIERKRGNIQHAEALEWRVRSVDPSALSWVNERLAAPPAQSH